MERIEKAAIWHRGRVYSVPRPGRHHDVIRVMHEQYGLGPECTFHQGFTTDAGRFVDREDAAKIAASAGQLGKRTRPPELYSEDVW